MAQEFDPLSLGNLTDLLKTSLKEPNRVIKREDSIVEFKESYCHGSMAAYFKTIAAFANNMGGYIVFGVGDKPRTLLGLREKSLRQFEELKPEELSKNLCDYFSPEIQWTHCTFEHKGLSFGIIYVYQLKNKPAICKKSKDEKESKQELREGDIYYRYGGRSERIRYPELATILNQQRQIQEKQWLRFLLNAAKIGVSNAALLDIDSGVVSGSGGSIIVDESILGKIAFIKEGEFREREGKPTLRLIGDVQTISGEKYLLNRKEKKVVRAITPSDIIRVFLEDEHVEDPQEYIKQICTGSSGYSPIHYYKKMARLKKKDLQEIINSYNFRDPAKKKILERLDGEHPLKKEFPKKITPESKKRKEYVEKWISESVEEDILDIDSCIQALLYIDTTGIIGHEEYIKHKLYYIYSRSFEKLSYAQASDLRKAICRIDEVLNSD